MRVTAQNNPKNTCIAATQMTAEQLFGDWDVQVTSPPAGLPDHAVLRLYRHAEFSESLAGVLTRDLATNAPRVPDGHAATAVLAGDLEAGMLLLDESSNRVNMSGTWNGEMVAGSCGQRFAGIWKDTSVSASAPDAEVPFVITRRP